MGALVDRCPECGVYIKKGALECSRCGWESEWRPSSEPAAERAQAPERDTPSLKAFLHGLALGALVVGLPVWVGALGLAPGVVDHEPEMDKPPAVEPAAVEQVEAETATEAEMEAAPEPELDDEAIAGLLRLLERTEAELHTWRGRYRVAYSDLHKVLELFARMKEVLGDAAGDGQAGAGEPGEGRDLPSRPQGR